MNSKKNNARIEKWRVMINEGVFRNAELLKSRIRKGIPAAMRQLAWPEIVKLQKFIEEHKAKYSYAKLANSPSNNISEIALDIPRTFPEEEDSKVLRRSMNNVLKAISIVYPKVGYCQGMNFLALRLLQILNDEQTFWLLHYLFESDSSLMKNFIDPKKIERQNFIFCELMKQHCAKICQQLQRQNITIQVFTVKWFMTIYSSVFSQELFYRIFEVFLNEGWSIIYAVALTLLRINEGKILKNNFQANMYLINAGIYQVDKIDQFLEEVYKIEIQKATIKALGDLFSKIEADRGSLKQGHTHRNSQIGIRQNENKRLVLPVPQDELREAIIFQAKSQEIAFNSFLLLNHRVDQNETKK